MNLKFKLKERDKTTWIKTISTKKQYQPKNKNFYGRLRVADTSEKEEAKEK